MDSTILNTISLCSGVGMLDEGVHAGLEFMGIRSRTVMFAEREACPVSILAARMEEGSLAPAPIWFGDFTELPAERFRGLVDGVVAGFPCQDLSVAGRRAGLNGKRSGLFFNVLDIADASGAWFLVLENVAGIASATASVVDEASASDYAAKPDGSAFSDVGIEDGMLLERAASRVMGELADRGWDAEWITLSASDVGASHGRARWFCFAWRVADSRRRGARWREHVTRAGWKQAEHIFVGNQLDDAARYGWPGFDGEIGRGRGIPQASHAMDDAELSERGAQRIGGAGGLEGHDGGWSEENCWAGIASQVLANAEDTHGRSELQSCGKRSGWSGFAGSGAPVANSCGSGLPQRVSRGRICERPTESNERANPELYCNSLFAPGPADQRWSGLLARFPWLAPAIGDEAAQSLLRGVADGLAGGLDFSYRAARLRAGGNGVAPLCAASAVVVLVRRSGIF